MSIYLVKKEMLYASYIGGNEMETKQIMLTDEGLKKLEDELEYLKTVKRKEVSAKIKEALGFGDLSENAEYDEAKKFSNPMSFLITYSSSPTILSVFKME